MRNLRSRRLFGWLLSCLVSVRLWEEPTVLKLVMSIDSVGSPEESCPLLHAFPPVTGQTDSDRG